MVIWHKQLLVTKAQFPLPELTGDRVDGRAFPLAQLTGPSTRLVETGLNRPHVSMTGNVRGQCKLSSSNGDLWGNWLYLSLPQKIEKPTAVDIFSSLTLSAECQDGHPAFKNTHSQKISLDILWQNLKIGC